MSVCQLWGLSLLSRLLHLPVYDLSESQRVAVTITARMLHDAGLEVVADGALPHVGRRLEVRLLAEREYADEEIDLGNLARVWVGCDPAERRL